MNDLRTSGSICAETVPSLLTAVRGQVRRLPEGVEKQRAELLAKQIKRLAEDGAREMAAHIRRQLSLMAG